MIKENKKNDFNNFLNNNNNCIYIYNRLNNIAQYQKHLIKIKRILNKINESKKSLSKINIKFLKKYNILNNKERNSIKDFQEIEYAIFFSENILRNNDMCLKNIDKEIKNLNNKKKNNKMIFDNIKNNIILEKHLNIADIEYCHFLIDNIKEKEDYFTKKCYEFRHEIINAIKIRKKIL